MKNLASLLAAVATVGLPLATLGLALAVAAWPQAVHAQTPGMEHRSDRRDTRQTSREVKHACNAGDNSRAECRQTKHSVKQEGRQTGHNGTTTYPH